MIDLKDFVENITKGARAEKATPASIVAFLVDNAWFGVVPTMQDGRVLLDQDQADILLHPLKVFLTEEGTSENLFSKLRAIFPLTLGFFEKFCAEEKLSEDAKFYLSDFLLYRLKKDIALYRDPELEVLLSDAAMDLTKTHGDLLTFFLAWLRTKTKTAYFKDYVMEKRYSMTVQNEAYSFDEYLELAYYIFNEDYCEEEEMYRKAAESKNYTDTWLYLSMHFVCSLRYTDLQRIYHPELPCEPEEVICKVAEGAFSAAEAREVLLSITDKLCELPLYPQKTDGTAGVGSIKIVVPTSCEEHFGRLFALAEAHRRLGGTADAPIVKKINTYRDISRYMGDEIGALFLNSDFRSRSATKSYLQSIHMLSDDILGEYDNGPNVKGYILAALARSHKGSYGEFAGTTFEYLKDANFSGLTPEYVAFELFERGVLSFMPSMLLNIVTDGEYNTMSVQNQTSMVKSLGLAPIDIENFSGLVEKARQQAETTIREVITNNVNILEALHRIGSGQAFSKQAECLCLLSAINKLCPFDSKHQCVGCQYELNTKSTFYLLISEYKRMATLFDSTENRWEKDKYKKLAMTVLLPKIDEMLCCIRENYGEEVYFQYEKFLGKNIL